MLWVPHNYAYDIYLSRWRSGTVRTRWARGKTPASAPGEIDRWMDGRIDRLIDSLSIYIHLYLFIYLFLSIYPGEAPAVADRTSMIGALWLHGTSTRTSSCNACESHRRSPHSAAEKEKQRGEGQKEHAKGEAHTTKLQSTDDTRAEEVAVVSPSFLPLGLRV